MGGMRLRFKPIICILVNIRVSNFFSIFEKSSGHKGNIVIIREAWMLLAQKNGH
jgi:hypothetical protein